MFEGFANQWTPLLPSRDVRRRPRSVVVAGERLVTWRNGEGRAGVLLDRCPHRGVSLSLGRPAREGRISCAFHGWEFDVDGACRYVPFNPDAPRQRLGATALPVRERGGHVWVFTGFEPAVEPCYPSSLDDPSRARQDHWEEWDAHWTRAMENMLDFPHLPYVHRTTIGRGLRQRMRRDSRLHCELTDTDYGFGTVHRLDDNSPGARLHWYRPHAMVLDTVPEPKMMRIVVWCVPAEAGRVRMILSSTRNIATARIAAVGVARLNVMILHQDRKVVESSDPPVVPAGRLERSVRSDRPTLAFRAWYLQHLADSSVEDPRTPAHRDHSDHPA